METGTGRLALAATLAAAAVIAGCGAASPSRSNSTIASGSASPNSIQTQIHDQSLAFSRCVRGNGVPNFPDPPVDGGYGLKSFAQQSDGETLSINGVSVNAPAFRAAMTKCHQYLPQQPAPTTANLEQQRVAAVRYGQCMRDHGINIADPKVAPGAGGKGIEVRVDIPSGMTQNSPAFVAADRQCARTSGFGSPPKSG